tara:strand:+ start:3194 stop:6685 length:3492 start_codon:yes stop_codon:yes gene_type:complete
MANKSEILNRLMIKKDPQKFQDIDIGIPQPQTFEDVTLQTPIADKQNSLDFPLSNFMTTLKNKSVGMVPIMEAPTDADAETKTPVKSKSVQGVVDNKLGVIDESDGQDDDGQDADGQDDDVVQSSPSTTLKIIRKLEIKIKLVQQSNPSTKRITKKPTNVIKATPQGNVQIGDASVDERLGKTSNVGSTGIKADAYYLANREKFIGFVTNTYASYTNDLDNSDSAPTCERDDDAPFTPMSHQKIVRDYMSKYSPYRGILLFHGLGSGKTCSSIAIAEGLKTEQQVLIMTPASLQMNYNEELKKCGDEIYKKNQYWEFVQHNQDSKIIDHLSGVLGLPRNIIEKNKGAWLVNVTKPPNFETLSSKDQKLLDDQINNMISQKYKFIKYNGLRKQALATLSKNGKINPFDNKVVIIDEAHNFVSRIVNKMGREDTLSGALYEYIMSAKNARVVMLTGTPIINYPNEIAIMFNMLRGYIKTWTFKLSIGKKGKISQKYFENLFKNEQADKNKKNSGAVMDYIEYLPKSTTLRITRNPFGFVNVTNNDRRGGVKKSKRGRVSDEDFEASVLDTLKKENITVVKDGAKAAAKAGENVGNNNISFYKPLPDTLTEFKSFFIDDKQNVKNMNLFKRRILGLSSYFRDIENLMPRYNKETDFQIVKVEMSDYQLAIYEKARKKERKMEKDNAKKKKKQMALPSGIFEETVSTYRIFSRAFCNFVFPEEIGRPIPGDDDDISTLLDEDDLDGLSVEEKSKNLEGPYDKDDSDADANAGLDPGLDAGLDADAADDKTRKNLIYKAKIAKAITELERNKDVYLTKEKLLTYSPKFLNILENVADEEHQGPHLIYSQFRTLEGIGIMKLVFETNGFVEFKIMKRGGVWDIDISEEDMQKPKFVLYTGSETAEEKELIRNIFNGAWKYVPPNIEKKLKDMHPDNHYGDIIKVIMITASGAEGISLKNVRYVHITEPYWHPVRTQQVVGRARRICSHNELPINMQTVEVFLYLMTLSKKQREDDLILELRNQDKSKQIPNTPFTSDETLYEIATMKEDITNDILRCVKETSFDCTLHAKSSDDKEQLKCFSFGSNDPAKFSYIPSYKDEDLDNAAMQNQYESTIQVTKITYKGKEYAYDKTSNIIYDYNSVQKGNPLPVGEIKTRINDGKKESYIVFD